MSKVRIRFAYKKGFRRVWAVASVLWVCFATLMSTRVSSTQLDEVLMAIFIPPIALYAIGVACVWIIEGFAKPE
jgi:Sec-independent protein secretion pathway component TatC